MAILEDEDGDDGPAMSAGDRPNSIDYPGSWIWACGGCSADNPNTTCTHRFLPCRDYEALNIARVLKSKDYCYRYMTCNGAGAGRANAAQITPSERISKIDGVITSVNFRNLATLYGMLNAHSRYLAL